MTITVRFFASLREKIGHANKTIEIQAPCTVSEVWNQSTNQADRPENVLVAVNQEYVDFNFHVSSGDEVAFFPPVTGG